MKARFLVYLSFICLFSACYEPQEGCLDPEATNLDLMADNACCCCCTYPNLLLSMQHTFQDTFIFRYNDTFNVNGTEVIFYQMQFYVSEIKLISGSAEFQVRNDIEVYTSSGSTFSVTDDFLLASRNTNTYAVGGFREPGSYEGLAFLVGVNDVLDDIILDSLPSDHPLGVQDDSMYVNDNYLSIRMAYKPLNVGLDSTVLEIFETAAINLSTSTPLTVTSGFDKTINLQIAYDKWFDGVDFSSGDLDAIKQNIVNNTSKAFSFSE